MSEPTIGHLEIPEGTDPTVRDLIERLRSEEPEVRAIAAFRLGAMGEIAVPAIPQLLAVLTGPTWGPSVALTPELLDKWSAHGYQTPDRIVMHALLRPGTLTARTPKTSPSFEAARALTAMGPAGMTALVATLGGTDVEARRVASLALAMSRSRESVDPLLARLEDDDDDTVRRNAACGLTIIDDERAQSASESALRSRDESACIGVLFALGAKDSPGALDVLLAHVRHRPKSIRSAALKSMAQLSDPRVLEAFTALVHDHDKVIRAAALDALRLLDSASTAELFIEALGDDDPNTGRHAAAELKRIGSQQVLERVIEVSRSGSPRARTMAVVTLGLMGGPHALKALSHALRDDDPLVRVNAADRLRWQGIRAEPRTWPSGRHMAMRDPSPEAREVLVEALSDEREDVRSAVAWALGSTGDSRAEPELIRQINDPDNRTFHRVISALTMCGGPDSVEPLIDLLSTKRKHAALDALRTIVTRHLGEDPDLWREWWRTTE